jgi:hypothetical protein
MNFQFSIVGLPRSRTYWFSKLLSSEGVHCFHDFHAYKYKIPMRKILGNSSFTPWQKHTGKIVIIERDRIDAEVSFLNYVDNPDALLTGKIFDKAEESLAKLEGLRVPYDRINERLIEIINYIGVDVPMDRIERYIDKELHSPDTSESKSTVAYG